MHAGSRRSSSHAMNVWPGWVDALSSLIMVIIFVLMIFVVAQFYLAQTLTGRDQALANLNRKIGELSELLNLERQGNADLRLNVAQLSNQLQASLSTREKLSADLGAVRDERDQLTGRYTLLSQRAETAAATAGRVGHDLEDAYKEIDASRDKIEVQLREIAGLQADLKALREAREKIEADLAAAALLNHQLQQKAEAISSKLEAETVARTKGADDLRLTEEQRKQLADLLTAERDRTKELVAKLSNESERTALAQREVEKREFRIRELLVALDSTETALTGERKLSEESRSRVGTLTAEITALRDQMSQLATALDTAKTRETDQKAQIDDLSGRLNLALVNKVEELARYRSEFFGRLREALGTRPDIRTVGDRFVFQSEVLFPTGSASLQEAGKAELLKLAHTLLDIARGIPSDVNWILRVDGHTDPRKISTPQFPSNWELSTSRAISVVKFLIDQGVPSERLAATGFGEYQPLDAGNGDEAFARNRRIELKLDQR
ncbi:MAG: peptidoglycan -binding protein [Rhodospirillaceae bacterium]